MLPIPEDPQDIRPLVINTGIPALTLPDTNGQLFEVTAAVHNTPTILLFYRGGW